MRKKHFIYISILFFMGFISCKKESSTAIAPVATQQFPDSILHPTSVFTFITPAGTISGYPNQDTVYYYLPSAIKVNSQSSLVGTYEWYLRRNAMPDSLMSTVKNPAFSFTSPISNASIVLTTKNNAGTTSYSKPFQLRSTPNGLKITSITIDTMSFINPVTTIFWNGTTGADVFCQITDGTVMVMDTMTGTGWSSAPSTIGGIYPVKTNLSAAPYTVKYPTGIKTFTISSAIAGVTMLDTLQIKIFNNNVSGTPDLIGSVNLIPSVYFGGTLPTTIYVNDPTTNLYIKLSVQWL